MSEKALRNIFIGGTLFFLAVLIVLTVNTLSEVASARTPGLTDQVVAGKMVWQSRNCNDCHTILGIGGYFAPDLTKEADRRDPAWLKSFLRDPQAAKPGTTMPDQRLSDADAANLVAFLQWVSKIDTNDWPPKPVMAAAGPAGAAGGAGAALFQRKGCSSCHMVRGQGSSGPGPDLSKIGSVPYDGLPNDAAFLKKWLEDPSAQKPGTTMPRVPLSPQEIDELVAYLAGLK